MRTLFAICLTTLLLAAGTAQAQQCAQPLTDGASPTASDCLFILKAAVGTEVCQPECVCAPSGTLPVKATDALLCLNAAVGAPVTLNCPCEPTTTSTTVSTTTTTVTLPPGDNDNDGLENSVDPCINEALNRCAGTIATDGNTGRPIRLNAVNPNDVDFACRGQRVDCNGDVWEADFGYNHQSAAFQCDLAGDACNIAGVEDVFGCRDVNTEDLFRCEHFGPPALTDLAYSFDVPNGSYIVNLLFGNVYRFTATVGSRLFDVAIESQVVLDDFDQVAAAGASGRALTRAIIVDVADGDGLQIEFIRGAAQNPAIKGIEVLAANP